MNDAQQQLAIIPASSLPTILAADKGGPLILHNIAAKVAAFAPDISTEAGRDEMRSLSRQVAIAKNALIKIGKDLTVGWRDQTKAVNAECNAIEAGMDRVRDAVRQPLTDWENAEKARVFAHESLMTRVLGEAALTDDIEVIDDCLTWLHGLAGYDWQEFAVRGRAAVAQRIGTLTAIRTDLVLRAEEAAELARLRAKEAEAAAAKVKQDRIDHEAMIANEAVERALRAANERDVQAHARIAQLERDTLAAIETERKRAADEAARVQAAADARAADVEHRKRINTLVLNEIIRILESCDGSGDGAVNHGEKARAIVIAIANGEVPRCRIEY